MKPQTLYKVVATATPPLIPITRLLRKIGGRAGARISPICEYSHLGLPAEVNRDWAILDTFDMYSPAHDHPQSVADVSAWFERAGFVDVEVGYGPNGVIGRRRRVAE